MLLEETFRVEPPGPRCRRYRAVAPLLLVGATALLLTLRPGSLAAEPKQAVGPAPAAKAAAPAQDEFDLTVQLVPEKGQSIDAALWHRATILWAAVDKEGHAVSLFVGDRGQLIGRLGGDGAAGADGVARRKIQPAALPPEGCTLKISVFEGPSFKHSGNLEVKLRRDTFSKIEQPLKLYLTAARLARFQLVSGTTGQPLAGRKVNLSSPRTRGAFPLPPAGAATVTDDKGLFQFWISPGRRYSLWDRTRFGLPAGWTLLPPLTRVGRSRLRTPPSSWLT